MSSAWTSCGRDTFHSCASNRMAHPRERSSNCRVKRRNMKFASTGTQARSRSYPTDSDRGRAGYLLLEALVALTLVLGFAAVLGPVLFQARRVMIDADNRIAAQALLRSLINGPLDRTAFASDARQGKTADLHWRISATP